MAWTVSTQTSVPATVELRAGNKTYFKANHETKDHKFRLLEQNTSTFQGEGNLLLIVTCATGWEVKHSLVSGAVTDAKAKKIGYVYSFCFEDGGDDDYNDVYVNLVAWRKEG